MSYQVELKQQDTSIRSMKYLVTLLVPDGRYMMGIGKWNGGNKKEAIKTLNNYIEYINKQIPIKITTNIFLVSVSIY